MALCVRNIGPRSDLPSVALGHAKSEGVRRFYQLCASREELHDTFVVFEEQTLGLRESFQHGSSGGGAQLGSSSEPNGSAVLKVLKYWLGSISHLLNFISV